ncbi:MAG: helix-turn-helix domain-containing protein [Christensenellaceae bacterium]|jgi:DNA-binding Xre family transcriptional regulator|nr:helix-turn-helix domain-containing protein [Christensenellaceae bacterium]
MVSYKRLWKLLIDKDMKKQNLVTATGISLSTLNKLNKGENLNTNILVRICNSLKCKLSDIMEIYPDDDAAPTKKERIGK